MRNSTLLVAISLGSLLLTNCGGSGKTQTTKPPQVPQLAGAWSATAPHSANGVNRSGTFIEFNLSQDGSTVSANQVAIMNVTFNGSPGDYTDATWSPQNCLPGPYSMTGAVSAPNMMSFTLQQTGGDIIGTATAGTGAESGTLSGTYNDPSCSGNNIQFIAAQSLALAGSYSNTCNPCGSADPSLVLNVTQDSSYDLTIKGSDVKDGSFTLSGHAIGSSMWISGVISGQNVSYYGWHYAALDQGWQQLYVVDRKSNAVVAIMQGSL